MMKTNKNKIIVFSYRNKGIPTIDEITARFIKFNMTSKIYTIENHSYALNKSNSSLHEYLFISQPKINNTSLIKYE